MHFVLRLLDTLLDVLIVLFVLAAAGLGAYALWDNQNIYQNADAAVYAVYRPAEEEASGEDGLAELRAVNPDVVAWLQVDDTQINYPVVQGEDNNRYVNTDAAGDYSLSGSIFLDYRNASDFSSPNSILYGHHMAKGTMFGQLDEYRDRSFFDSHRTGSLYYNGTWYSITFFAFLQADAYNTMLYDPGLTQSGSSEAFCDYLRRHAQYFEAPDISPEARFITLSTCRSNGAANGRYLLVGILHKTT